MSVKQNTDADAWTDPDDAPTLLTDTSFEQAAVYEGSRVVRRGRPKLAHPKAQVTLRLDVDVLADLRATGPGWQTRANAAIKEWLAMHQR